MRLARLVFFSAMIISRIAAADEIRIPLENGVEPPALLSATGLFVGKVANLQPVPSLRPYEVNQPLWVDFAQKQRWIHLPEGTKIEFSAKEAFGFPVGTILVKHFRMETSRNVFQNLETRVLVKKNGENNWAGFTYQWDGEDARLVAPRESPSITLQVDATALGGARAQVFKIPSRNQCLQCHHSSVGYVRSVIAPQLNRSTEQGNQLEEWNRQGMFDRDIGLASQYDVYAPVAKVALPLEARVKSYLAVNCSHCHNPDPTATCSFAGLDFRYDSFRPADLVASGHLVPGAKEKSELFQRMISVQAGERMPYIGSVIPDEPALTAVGEWIDGLQKAGTASMFGGLGMKRVVARPSARRDLRRSWAPE